MNNEDEIIKKLTKYLFNDSNGSSKYGVSKEMMTALASYVSGNYDTYDIGDDEKKTIAHSKNTDYLDTIIQSLRQKDESAPVVKMLNISNLDVIREQFFYIEEEVDKYTFYNNFDDYVVVHRNIYGLTFDEPYVLTTLFVDKLAKKNDKITLKSNTKSPIEQIKEQLRSTAGYRIGFNKRIN
jgi:hypothetical protein